MRRIWLTSAVGFIVMVLSPAASSQEMFRLNGYVVTFPSYLTTNSTIASLFGSAHEQFVDVSRLRLRPSLMMWENGYFMLEYEVNAAYSTSSSIYQNQSVNNPRQIADLTWTVVEGSRWNIIHFIDRLYFRQSTAIGDFTVGRQRISWGTGRVWNPTDLFNPLNPTSFSKIEKDGVDALLAKFVLGNFSDLSLVFNAKENFRENNFGFRFRSNVEGFDFSAMSGVFDKRIIVGADFAGSIFDAGVRGEGIYSTSEQYPATNFVSLILGTDNQFTDKLYALAEYHFNGRGKTAGLYDFQGLLKGEILNVGRHYVVAQVAYLVHPLVSVSMAATRNLDDESGFTALTAVYSSSDETSLSIGGQNFYGEPFTEYWYYPSSVYLKFDFYF